MRLAVILLSLSLGAVAASDADVKQKIRTVKETVKQGSTGIPAISGYLRDPSPEVRREAVRALTAIGGLASLDPLALATTDGDPEVQQRAAAGLVNFYLPGYADTSSGILGGVKRAGTAVTGLFGEANDQVIDADITVRPEVVTALSKLVIEGNGAETRAIAARACGVLRARAALPSLTGALKSRDDVVMLEVLIALQKIKDPAAGPSAIFLVRDLNEKIQIAAIETVGLLRVKEAVPDLKRVLTSGPKKARRAALAALGVVADPDLRTLFVQYLADKDDGMKASAAEGLARVGAASDRTQVESLFRAEKKTQLKLSLAFALAGLGDADMATDGPLRYLSSSLTSKSWRGVAEPFLAELGRRTEVRLVLHQMLSDLGDKDELAGLADVLADCGTKDSLPPLEALSRHSDPNVTKAALRAIRMINARG